MESLSAFSQAESATEAAQIFTATASSKNVIHTATNPLHSALETEN